VIEHVPLSDLPAAWRSRLATPPWPLSHVTVHLELEANLPVQSDGFEPTPEDPIFGMWRDRHDTADVEQCVRCWRSSRFMDL